MNRPSTHWAALLFALAVSPSWAANPPPPQPGTAQASAPAPAPAAACPSAEALAKSTKVDQPITVVRPKWSPEPTDSEEPGTTPEGKPHGPTVTLRDEIVVHVQGLDTLLAHAKCASPNAKIVLFLDGRPVIGAKAFPPTDPLTETLRFRLERREESRETWTHLLGKPSFDAREMSVSVGLQDEHPISSEQTVMLKTIPRGWFWAWTVLLFLLMAAFLALAIRSDVLRDIGPQPGAGQRKPYSLAKMQASWWFFLVLASFLFIGLVAGDYNTSITGTVLTLMGISAGTAVGSATIDVARPPPAAPPLVAPAPPATKGHWWLDILSDDHGVNFHRFQMAAWTLVLGVIFVHDVYVGLAMPQFDNALLGLLGISAGTYLGLKTTTENK